MAGPNVVLPGVGEPMVDIKTGQTSLGWSQFFQALQYIANNSTQSGPTGSRPTSIAPGRYIGMPYYDTTMGAAVVLASVNPDVWAVPAGGGGGGGGGGVLAISGGGTGKTTASTAAAALGALQISNNLSELYLAAGVAASNIGALQIVNNLSDVGSIVTAAVNLGVPQIANNLSELTATAGTARANIGVLSAATHADTFFCQVANNLSDVTAVTARANLSAAVSGANNDITSLGVVTTATAAPLTNSTRLATTAYADAACAALLVSTPMTGAPTAPTAAPNTNTTQLSTTAFVTAAISASQAAIASFDIVCEGRITWSSGNPVPTTDGTSIGTLYFTPYQGHTISLYYNGAWMQCIFTEGSFTPTLAAGATYDVFGYYNGATLQIYQTAWAGFTTRAAALSTQDGVLVLASDHTRRYLGTYSCLTGSTLNDTPALRGIYNYYNRVARELKYLSTAATWTYTTATWRQANASAAFEVVFVIGWPEEAITTNLTVTVTNTLAQAVAVALQVDGTTSPATGGAWSVRNSGAATNYGEATAELTWFPTVGWHFIAWLEYSLAAGVTTWYGNGTPGAAVPAQSGITGTIYL